MSIIENSNYRKLFYKISALILILSVISTSLIILQNLKIEKNKALNQFSEHIINEKKQAIKQIVNNIFFQIKAEKEFGMDHLGEDSYNLLLILKNIINSEHAENFSMEKRFFSNKVQFIIYNRKTGKIIKTSLNKKKENQKNTLNTTFKIEQFVRKNLIHFTEKTKLEDIYVSTFVAKTDFDDFVKENMKKRIRNTKLQNNGYIWVNEVFNYDGGINYGRKLVYPNFPKEEGEFISTNITDARGNLYYKQELEGVKKKGEVYFEFYYDKNNNDNSFYHKLMFAKLFKEYNWIIVTGVFLDDIDKLIEEESKNIKKSFGRQIINIDIIVFFTVIILLFAEYKFEEKFSHLLNSYNNEIEDKKNQLKIEKQKVKNNIDKINNINLFDELTNLRNKRWMENSLEEETSRCYRHNYSFGIIICNIDNLKKINTSFGYDAGNIVIKRVSSLLTNSTRLEDKISRWDSENFLILLTHNNNRYHSIEAAERLRESIENLQIFQNKKQIKVTATMGVSAFHGEKDYSRVIEEAIKAMVRGKNSGKNKIEFYS